MKKAETCRKIINKYFESYNRYNDESIKPFNGVVVRNNKMDFSYYNDGGSDNSFTPGKKYRVVDGYIVDNENYVLGCVYYMRELSSYGFYDDFAAAPLDRRNIELICEGMFSIVKEEE